MAQLPDKKFSELSDGGPTPNIGEYFLIKKHDPDSLNDRTSAPNYLYFKESDIQLLQGAILA